MLLKRILPMAMSASKFKVYLILGVADIVAMRARLLINISAAIAAIASIREPKSAISFPDIESPSASRTISFNK